MKTWFTDTLKKSLSRRVIAPMLAISTVGSLAAYQATKTVAAKSASAVSSTAPLDDNSMGALLALDNAMEKLAAHVTPAIVNVAVTSKPKAEEQTEIPDDKRQFFGPGFNFPHQQQPQIGHGIGSGVIISPDGYVVTNNHVVDGAVDLRVTMSDRRVLPAKLVGADPMTDLAVIKVDGKNLPNAPWGDSTKLHQGQTVLAFGNPFGFRFTVTRGIVSALNRPNPSPTDARKPGQFIQTDAAINPGNSGGPLVNARGEVVGINTFLISQSGTFSGMGFAIPSQIVRPTVEALIRDGKVNHGYVGIGITDVTPENAKFFESKDNYGAIVTQVEPNSPGAKAGLKVGDLITGVDGRDVSDAGQLQVVVGQTRPGTTVKLRVLRDGKSMDLPVTLEKMGARDKGEDESASSASGRPRWGLGLADVTPDVRRQLRSSGDLKGAVIERVLPGSPADNAGLRPGDVILVVNRRDMETAADVQKALASVPK